jgi:hypothetical protein
MCFAIISPPYTEESAVRYLSIVLLLLFLLSAPITAQPNAPLQQGDPPVATLISVSPPTSAGIVTVSGSAGAVFPNAQVSIRNLFTGQTVTATAGFTGAFRAEIYGTGQTPFLVSPSTTIPEALQNHSGALAGGPATIVYATNADPRTDFSRVTQLILDGMLEDWDTYPQSQLAHSSFSLLNNDSLYFAFPHAIETGASLVVQFSLDANLYELTINPNSPLASQIRQLEPTTTEPTALPIIWSASVQDGTVTQAEFKLSRSHLPLATFEMIRLEQTFTRTRNTTSEPLIYSQAIAVIDSIDGIVYPNGHMTDDFTRFHVAGSLGAGQSYWSANGRIRSTTYNVGDQLELEMDFTLYIPDLGNVRPDIHMIGELGLQPVTVNPNGEYNIPATHTNNGWSSLTTPSGLAIDNITGDVVLGKFRIPSQQVIRRDDTLTFGGRFSLSLPQQLPAGIYTPTFTGSLQVGDATPVLWTSPNPLGDGGIYTRHPITRLPIVLNIGEIERPRLTWTLFHDRPSEGSRGILATQDSERLALSNRVRFNSSTYILPPNAYALEPHLLNMLPNAYDITLAPLLPLLTPGGRMKAVVTLPDGTTDDLPDVPFIQNRLSTATINERDAFGAQSPLDSFRLMTGNPFYQSYPFTQYGDYEIQLTGDIDDITGNRYRGGGTYRLTIAEQLRLQTGVLAGTPFNIGDALYLGGHIEPNFPAEISVRVQTFPLVGEPTDTTYHMTADRFGVFAPDAETEPFIFLDAGEYLIDYEARYWDNDGRLWAGSVRSAGVISSNNRTLIAHGGRGTIHQQGNNRPAWFDSSRYPSEVGTFANYPYFSGSVIFTPDLSTQGVNPILSVQDTQNSYQDWLLRALPAHIAPFGVNIIRLAHSDELPLLPVLVEGLENIGAALLPDFIVNRAYGYVSAVRPDVSVRQYVIGENSDGLLFHWDNNDPLNQQISAGNGGNRDGDFIFLFGGVVVKNAEANIRQTAPYASLAVVVDGESTRVVPPLQSIENRSIPPLITINGREYHAFFHPTGIRPAQVIEQGERVAIAGQSAPTLPAWVTVKITAPDGTAREFSAPTNEIGYFYQPQHDFYADQVGQWHVQITTTPDQSASFNQPSLSPSGGVLSALNDGFSFYVLPNDAQVLDWSLGGDTRSSYAPGSRLNINVRSPQGWTQTTARYESTTAGYHMQSADVPVLAQSIAYQFDPANLAENFPIETSGGGAGARGGDTITITFIIKGIDTNGNDVFGIRRLYVFHDLLVSVDESVLAGQIASSGE